MSLINSLPAIGPAAERADKLSLYGWLIGDWTMDATVFDDDGTAHPGQGSIHFGWVLQGRAIQDVWVLPGVFHGTTLRIYDPGLDAWHIIWSDPVRQYFSRQIGRGNGRDIVQQGRNDAGELVRWSFTDITADSFRWIGERSRDDAATWQLQAIYLARRADLPENRPMLDHVSIGAGDLAAARRFYDATLQPLGYARLSDGPGSLGYGGADIALWIYQADRPTPDEKSGLHFCFAAPSRDSVDAFHAAALGFGGKDNGPPGPRPDYAPGYYAAFVIDPNGYRIEAHHDG